MGKKAMMIEANDPIGVQENQIVRLSIPTGSAVQAAFVVYIIPLIALIAGVLLGEYLGRIFGVTNLLEIAGGAVFLGLSLLIVRYYNNLFGQQVKNQPVIVHVIE
jgi:sigma-E factor negative regulatory protein RseC